MSAKHDDGFAIANPLNEQVEEFVCSQEAAGVLPHGAGLAVSVIEDENIAFSGTYGWRARDRSLPVAHDTLFEIGSLTKSFTATALLMASDAGQLELKRPINASNDLLRLSDSDVSRHVAIADILCHQTGLPGNDLLWYFSGFPPEELLRRLAHLDVVPGAFGRTFIYNNLMYGALGLIFTDLVGDSWEAYVTRRILRPLGMTSTLFQISDEIENVALPYVGTERVRRVDTTPIAAAAGMKSTLDAMTRWVRFHLQGGRSVDGKRVLSFNTATLMRNREIRVETANPILFHGLEWLTETVHYGFGWFVGSTRGMDVVFHPGFIDGFSVAVAMIPEKRLGFVVLMNVNFSAVPGRLIEYLLAVVLDQTRGAVNRPADETLSGRARSVIGAYDNPAYGAITIQLIRNRLVVKYADNEWPLTWTGERIASFELTAFGLRVPLSVEFQGDNGRIDQLVIPFSMDPRARPQVFTRRGE